MTRSRLPVILNGKPELAKVYAELGFKQHGWYEIRYRITATK
jgi:hypothetical protein